MSSMPPPGTHHKRPLPESCVDFSSKAGREIFNGALAAGGMEVFFQLMPQFQTQNEPAYCGLATLAMSLNALQVDPNRVWKGVWRWYDESLLSCCKGLDVVQKEGITLDEFFCLARCHGIADGLHRASTAEGHCCGTLEAFRASVDLAATETDAVLVVSYSRRILGQTGDGHFSPIGGYYKGRDIDDDKVLLLDVARFKYPPHWVPLPLLFEAMLSLDKSTLNARGWVRLTRASSAASGGGDCASCCASDEEVAVAAATLGRITCGRCPSLEGLEPVAAAAVAAGAAR